MRIRPLALATLILVHGLSADTGILIPGDNQQPDPSIFSLREMKIDVRIDNGTARVRTRQIFGSHTDSVTEGVYQFVLPTGAAISDFAVWDDVTRIPGVILERRRAGEIYATAKAQAIDPGLLQAGDGSEAAARQSMLFTAKIVPIPRFGTKRVEVEYQHPVVVEHNQSEFVIPLKPDAYGVQTVGRLSINVELRSEHAITQADATSKSYPLTVQERTPNVVRASFSGNNVKLNEDFALRYTLDASQADTLRVVTQREEPTEPGFFGARMLIGAGANAAAANAPARTVIVLFDTSLSMQWEKLEQAFTACETTLKKLRPADRFNLILFDSEVKSFSTQPRNADPAAVEQALTFIRNSRIRGGTDLKSALAAGLAQSGNGTGERYLVVITDGGPTEGVVNGGKLATAFQADWRKLPPANRPHLFVLGVGDDANQLTLKMLASNNGLFEWIRSTEPAEFKLNAFLGKMGQQPVRELTLTGTPAGNLDLIYPLEDVRFAGSVASWVGQYRRPAARQTFSVQGSRDGTTLRASTSIALPASAQDHPMLPRTWAKARVDALLEKIEREGEDRQTIDEIIRLSKKYKFVTPYTSFLAVPRALLRPRVIRPGDPVLRVRTDPSISSVIALFPFGLTKPLRFLPGEGAWQTRFLAPVDMADGTYQVRLILRDRSGRVYRESKSFVIASKTPTLKVKLSESRARRGQTVKILADASANTRTITARMYGALPVSLRWSGTDKASVAELTVPDTLPAGKYQIHVTAEDIAHNIGSQEVSLEIW